MGRGPSIENRKNAEDAKRGRLFTKLIREITVAARGGADPDGNPRLRLAVDRALTSNMTKDTIARAIKRGSGNDDGARLEEVRYEGYGPGGVAILVECMTDNPTRTVAEVRHAFSRHSGNLGSSGSVSYLFSRIGVLRVQTPDTATSEKVLEVALEASADDVRDAEGFSEVTVSPDRFEAVRAAMSGAGLVAQRAEVAMRAATLVQPPAAQAGQLSELLEALEELDDVQNIFHNAQLPAGSAVSA